MKKNYVIIGASATGISTAMTLSTLGHKSIVIAEQSELPYNKCLLAEYAATTSSARLNLNINLINIDLRLNSKAIDLDLYNQVITIQSAGRVYELSYDKLCIATGTHARISSVLDNNQPIFTYHTRSDVEVLHSYIKQNRINKVAIIGAGINGIELACALRIHNIEVVLLEQQETILNSWHDLNASFYIQNLLELHGVTVVTNTKMSFAQSLPAPMIICAAGVEPATAWLSTSGIIRNNNFIQTNSFLQTNRANVYAGGDCAQINNARPSMIWSHAVHQGIYIGKAMVQEMPPYIAPVSFIQSNLFGKPVTLGGTLMNANTYHVEKKCDSYVKYAFNHKGNLQGFLVIGTLEKVSILRNFLNKKYDY